MSDQQAHELSVHESIMAKAGSGTEPAPPAIGDGQIEPPPLPGFLDAAQRKLSAGSPSGSRQIVKDAGEVEIGKAGNLAVLNKEAGTRWSIWSSPAS